MRSAREYAEAVKQILRNVYSQERRREEAPGKGSNFVNSSKMSDPPLIEFASFDHEACNVEAAKKTILDLRERRFRVQ